MMYHPMALLSLKQIAAFLIFLLTFCSGLLSVRFITRPRFQNVLRVGDAFSNGIFLGVALFHLFPDAVAALKELAVSDVYLKVTLLALASASFFWIFEKIYWRQPANKQMMQFGALTVVLSMHALIAGITLGISNAVQIVSVLFVAILAHKSFETFAFVVRLHRSIQQRIWGMFILLLFALVTPLGILLGMSSATIFSSQTDATITACFSAISAGTFFYIGLSYAHCQSGGVRGDYSVSQQVIATMLGMGLMAVVGFFV